MTFGILLVRTTLTVSSDGFRVQLVSLRLRLVEHHLSETPCVDPRLEFFLMTKVRD